ncbi:MAG TPA: DNA-3-methyladenine glycosylase, partial [Isosphaeraceae bacterium]|nr:DNA-3-methyladenine glycosylase [Isosphaeraceae bacterium]
MILMQILPKAFYDRDAERVARDLLGKLVVRLADRRRQIGRIVETEAYLGPHDLAAHSAR